MRGNMRSLSIFIVEKSSQLVPRLIKSVENFTNWMHRTCLLDAMKLDSCSK
jgi:hypothetical protein